MRFPARFAVSLLVVGFFQVASVADVGATVPQSVSGNFTTSAPVFTGVSPAGVNLRISAYSIAQFSGAFSGSTLFQGTFILDPLGNIRGHATEKFTGTVSGVGAGTVLFQEETTVSAAGVVHVTATITHGSGGLAHLSGRVIFDGTSAPDLLSAGTYIGQIQA